MSELTWQKSTHSAEAANCLYVAAAASEAIHLRESDEPDVIVTTSPDSLRELIRTLKARPSPRTTD
jgi:hypothetical protein